MWRGDEILLLLADSDFYDEGDLSNFGLPGGGIEGDESASKAVSRELGEETGLRANGIKYLFSYFEDWGDEGRRYSGQDHNVFLVDTDGDVSLGPEIARHVWWNTTSELPITGHVQPILARL